MILSAPRPPIALPLYSQFRCMHIELRKKIPTLDHFTNQTLHDPSPRHHCGQTHVKEGLASIPIPVQDSRCIYTILIYFVGANGRSSMRKGSGHGLLSGMSRFDVTADAKNSVKAPSKPIDLTRLSGIEYKKKEIDVCKKAPNRFPRKRPAPKGWAFIIQAFRDSGK